MQDLQQIVEEIVVFKWPDGGTFSNDPRWNDPAVQKAWKAWDEGGRELVEEEEYEDYGAWNNDELRAELVSRKLSVDGKKAEMVKRLEDSDAAGYTPPED